MDEPHLAAAFRYVTLNPATARRVRHAENWPRSSARTHLGFGDDALTDLARLVSDFPRRRKRRAALEAQTRRRLSPLERGPKRTDRAG
jgi:hypothetical protein